MLEDYLSSMAALSADSVEKTRSKSPRRSPGKKHGPHSLSSFLDSPPLETPDSVRKKVPSLATFFHSGMGGSMRSLSSRDKAYGTELFDSSLSKPSYDDDAMSYLNTSVSSGNPLFSPSKQDQSPSNSTSSPSVGMNLNIADMNSGHTPKKRRGRRPQKPKEAQISFPNL